MICAPKQYPRRASDANDMKNQKNNLMDTLRGIFFHIENVNVAKSGEGKPISPAQFPTTSRNGEFYISDSQTWRRSDSSWKRTRNNNDTSYHFRRPTIYKIPTICILLLGGTDKQTRTNGQPKTTTFQRNSDVKEKLRREVRARINELTKRAIVRNETISPEDINNELPEEFGAPPIALQLFLGTKLREN